jgi:predicted phosphodiesterase
MIRLGIISDVHGNLPALETALTALTQDGVTQIVCLGDVAVFGPQPLACVQRLRAEGIPVVAGNTDAWALNPVPHAHRDDDTPYFNDVEQWTAAQLDDQARRGLASFPPLLRLTLQEGLDLVAYHGTPQSFLAPIYPTTPAVELTQALAGEPAALYAGGHVHEQFVRRHGPALVLNPGSVGLPYFRTGEQRTVNPTYAEYAVIELREQGAAVSLRRASYPLQDLEDAVRMSGMPHADWWLTDWRQG